MIEKESSFSDRFLYFEKRAIAADGLLKEGEARVFVTSRFMETRELYGFITDFLIYETNADGKWGRLTKEPSRGLISTVIPTYAALKFVAFHDCADITPIVKLLRRQ